jgi:uncharacterized protein (DUF736 family)
MPKDTNELGALWIKRSSKGEYMTGMVNGVPVVVFRNDRKREGSNAPDWRVLKSKPQDGRATSRPAHSERPEPDFASDPEW